MKNEIATKSRLSKLWQRVIDILGHPAWNGLSCFFTALSVFGLGSILIGYLFGLFSHVQDFFTWLLSPVWIPAYLVVISVVIILSFIFTSVHRKFFRRGQKTEENSTVTHTNEQSEIFELSDLDIDILKQLATSKEEVTYWVDVSLIAGKHDLTEIHADYFLRQLEKEHFVQHHIISGHWGINDMGIDYLITRQLI